MTSVLPRLGKLRPGFNSMVSNNDREGKCFVTDWSQMSKASIMGAADDRVGKVAIPLARVGHRGMRGQGEVGDN